MTKEIRATGIKSWPEEDRPREKLLKKGAGTLSNSELPAILFFCAQAQIGSEGLPKNV